MRAHGLVVVRLINGEVRLGSGTLIHNNIVLTAAHILPDKKQDKQEKLVNGEGTKIEFIPGAFTTEL